MTSKVSPFVELDANGHLYVPFSDETDSSAKAKDAKYGKLIPIKRPIYQMQHHNYDTGYKTLDFANPPSTTLTTATVNKLTVEGDVKRVTDFTMQFSITNSNTATALSTTPAQNYFSEAGQRLTWRANKGAGDIIQEANGLSLFSDYITTQSDEAMTGIRGMTNTDTTFISSGTGGTLATSASRTDWVPWIGNWIGIVKPDFRVIKPVQLIAETRASSTSTNGTLVTNSVSAVFSELTEEAFAQKAYEYSIRSAQHKYIYLNPQFVEASAVTVTASTDYKLPLDSLHGQCSHCVLFIRASTTVANCMTFSDLGDDGTINITSASGEKLLSTTDIPVKLLKYHQYPKVCPSQVASGLNCVIIPFCSNIPMAYQGVKKGYRVFDGTKQSLVIHPNASWSTSTYTITAVFYMFREMTINQYGDISVKECDD